MTIFTQHLRASCFPLLLAGIAFQAAHAQRPTEEIVDPFAAPAGERQPSEMRGPRGRGERARGEPARGERGETEAFGGRLSAAERIEAELNKTTELDVVEMPLKDVVLYLSERHQIPLVLNRKKLDEAHVPLDSPLTKSLRGVTLRSALNLMLAELECAYVIKDEVLQITTIAHARTILEMRVYDCRDLLGRQEPPGGGMPPRPATSGGGVFGRGRAPQYEERVQKLLDLIVANVDSHTWRAMDAAEGDDDDDDDAQLARQGAASEYDGLIIITQTARTHEKVERLLNMLREAADLENRVQRVVR